MRWFVIACPLLLAACASVPPAAPDRMPAVASSLVETPPSNTNGEQDVKVGLWLGIGLGVLVGVSAAEEIGESVTESLFEPLFDGLFDCLLGDCGDED
jgi:uncharacterized membrane protein YfcA